MVESDVGDEHNFSALLKIHFDTGMVRSLGAMHLLFYNVPVLTVVLTPKTNNNITNSAL
jgi:hypothetical protein